MTAWKRGKNLIAERFGKHELPGFLKEKFEASGDEAIVLEKGGEIYTEKDHGTLYVGRFERDFTDVLMIDKSQKRLEKNVRNISLSDGSRMTLSITIDFRVLSSDRFSGNMMGQRRRLSLDDVWNEVDSGILCKKIIPMLQAESGSQLAKDGGDFVKKVKKDIEGEVRETFREWGLLLVSLSARFDVPERSEEIVEKVEEFEGSPKTVKTEGTTLEDERESLEKERLRKEVEMELEKKQMQKDTEDALEGMKLREIMKEGEDQDEPDDGGLEEELKDLRKAKEITERKFYKKELSEDSFQRMMEKFEGRIIEIEAKLKK